MMFATNWDRLVGSYASREISGELHIEKLFTQAGQVSEQLAS